MRRTTWTDERLDERMNSMDATFRQIFDVLDALREEMRGLRADVSALQRQIAQIGWALAGTQLGVIVALVVALVSMD
jgi:polyhydroxyalkanoate synthesis regulator phasin